MEEKTNIFVKLFSPIKWILNLINNYFKSFVFLLILYLIFGSDNADLTQANLTTINLNGAIVNSKNILAKIDKAQQNSSIKGVLFDVDSPGGSLAPSTEIAYAIKELKKHKPVIAYASGTMASGSYYASIWSDKIYANPGSFIGSIGVIFQSFNVENLAKQIGIEAQSIKAGRFKEAGTIMRKWTDDEKQSLEKLINDSYALFVNDVANARGLKIEDKNVFADARVFLANEAKKVGLIDEVGTLNDAKKALELISGVKNPQWETEDKIDKFLNTLTSESSKMLINVFYGLKAY